MQAFKHEPAAVPLAKIVNVAAGHILPLNVCRSRTLNTWIPRVTFTRLYALAARAAVLMQ
jgi:hypothetical protein